MWGLPPNYSSINNVHVHDRSLHKGEASFTFRKYFRKRLCVAIFNKEKVGWSDSSKTNEKHHGSDSKIN